MSLIKVIKLNLNSSRKCTACGMPAAVSVITQTEWEHKRGKQTTCFSLCGNHGIQFSKNMYMQVQEPIVDKPEIVN